MAPQSTSEKVGLDNIQLGHSIFVKIFSSDKETFTSISFNVVRHGNCCITSFITNITMPSELRFETH